MNTLEEYAQELRLRREIVEYEKRLERKIHLDGLRETLVCLIFLAFSVGILVGIIWH